MPSAAPEQFEAYTPTGETFVAVVEQSAGVDGVIAGAYEGLIAGTVPPKIIVSLDAVTTTAAGVTETVPATYVKE